MRSCWNNTEFERAFQQYLQNSTCYQKSLEFIVPPSPEAPTQTPLTPFMLQCSAHPEIRELAEYMQRLIYVDLPREVGCYTKPQNAGGIPDWINIIITMVFFLIGVIGIVGNSLTCWVIYKNRNLQTHTNYFLASLAMSDFMLILVGVPFDIIHSWFPSQPPDIPGYCEFTSTTISFFTFVSILTIVALTGERYAAICKPFSILKFNKQRVRRVIYAIWICAFIPSVYLGMQYKQVMEDFCGYNRALGVGIGHCDYVTSPDMIFRYPFELAMILTFVLPMMFIFFCYVRILHTLNRSYMARHPTVHIPLGPAGTENGNQVHRSSIRESIREKFSGKDRSNRDSVNQVVLHVHHKNSIQVSQQAHRMVIKMLATVSVTFFICYLPYHLERLIAQYIKEQCKSSMLCLLLYPITGVLQYVSATLNPIFYSVMSERFRVAFKSTFNKILRKHKEYNNIGSMTQRRPMLVVERRGTRCTEVLSTETPAL
ncbi:unnamed protein product, partial [Mesorhabditis spiculigera]